MLQFDQRMKSDYRHGMAESASNDTCPKCGGELYQTDKNTFTGEVWREFTCRRCGHIVDVNEGTALWKVLHDYREKSQGEMND